MIEAHLDPERLLLLAREAAAATPSESAHLGECPECRLERDLLRASRRLGAAEVTGLDPDRLAERLAVSLRAPRPVVRPQVLRWAALAAAAGFLLLLYNPRGAVSEPMAGPPRAAMLHELDSLSVAELEAVLETLPRSAERAPHVESAPLDQLDAKALERVLQSISME